MKRIIILLFFTLTAFPADYYNWSTRTDRHGKPAGIFTTTPFPITETSTTYAIINDEGTKTFTLGTIYFVDNGASGCTSGNTSYNPTNRTCTGGAYTVYTTVAAALAAVSSGNKTILVRDGTYSENDLTYNPGTDDTHRYMICGYSQERPIIDGNDSLNAIFRRTTNANAYFTLQRLKLQNNKERAVNLGYKTTYKYDAYFSLIDVEVYNCDNDLVASSGNIYFMNADYAFVHHVTSHHTMGHCLKIGDNAQAAVVEWTLAYECGYWSGMMLEKGITNWVSDGPASHPSGIDCPSDDGENAAGYKVRYNIVYDTLFYGVQLRNTTGFSFHHNEIYNTPHFDDVAGAASGATGSPQLLILGYGTNYSASGSAYSNVIRDSADATSSGITINSIKDGYAVNVYNNLVYNNPLAEIYFYGYLGTPGTTRSVGIYNNTLYANGTNPAIYGPSNWSAGEVNIKGNIIYQAGAGACTSLDADMTRDYNLYYYPSGSRGSAAGAHDISGSDPLLVVTPSGAYSYGEGNLSVGSPAIDAFPTASAPVLFTIDFNGGVRPYGSAWDIGWHEYGSTVTFTGNGSRIRLR